MRSLLAAARSPRGPQLVAAAGLLVGVPLMLRSPPWCDITLYDVAARTLLAGGVPYRDVFDTNTPGFVWALAAVRAVFGPSYEALWAVDLAIVAGVLALVDRLAAWGGGTPAARWWAVAAAAWAYPFWNEAVHAQRDVWLSLPALGAVALRVRRGLSPPVARPAFRAGALEGVLWGLAVWVKPHAALLAAACWLLTARRVAGRRAPADLAGNLAGGLAVGAVGVAALVALGAWPYFLDVFTNWNTHYAKSAWVELDARWEHALRWFPPWSLFVVPTVPLALYAVARGRPWAAPAGGADDARFARAALGGMYLAWAGQAIFVQKALQYVHVTETFLMLGLWAAYRWWLGAVGLGWVALSTALWTVAPDYPALRERADAVFASKHLDRYHFPRHPAADPARLGEWAGCWAWGDPPGGTPARRDRLRVIVGHHAAIGWGEIDEAADYLRGRGAGDGEVVAWHDSPHAVYLALGVKPGLRFMHTGVADAIRPDAAAVMAAEIAANPRARFAVTDLERAMLGNPGLHGPAGFAPGPSPADPLPPQLSAGWRELFPYNQRAVFRTRGGVGRYVVHEIVGPPGSCRIP